MYDEAEGKSKIPRTELVHGSENVVDFLVEFMHKAKLRIDVCVDHTRPGLAVEIRRLMDALIDAKKRQVKIRYITEITKDNLSMISRIAGQTATEIADTTPKLQTTPPHFLEYLASHCDALQTSEHHTVETRRKWHHLQDYFSNERHQALNLKMFDSRYS